MLCDAASRLGIQVAVLADLPDDPAALVCQGHLALGSLKSKDALEKFFAKVTPAAIESEFVNCDVIEAAGGADLVIPSLACIRIVQNKLEQKLLLDRINVPTSKLLRKLPRESYDDWIARVITPEQGEVVLKWAEMGYDGKGTLIQGKQADFVGEAREFCHAAAKRSIEVYAEQKVPFLREVALVAVRGKTGAFATYPLVISEQVQGICKRVMGPATALGVDPAIEAMAREYAQRISEAVGIVGTFAVEFFEAPGGLLLVNEIAPRVHNTGHYTIDAAVTSQFENHWRAILGMPLGSTDCQPYFAMLNLLGPAGVTCPDGESVRPAACDAVTLYWYFKKELRPGRKLGHLNTWANSAAQLQQNINLMAQIDQNWVTRCQSPSSNQRN